MSYLDPIDIDTPEAGDLFDELPLWSAPFGLWMLDRVPMRPWQTILDLGAGTGFLSVELAERSGVDTHVIAVDPWHAAMARLRKKIVQRGLTNITLIEQDAAVLDLPDGSVDLIVSNLGVNNFADPAAVLRVCARVARPKATFLLTTNLVGHMAEFYDVFRQVLHETGQADRLGLLDAHIAHRATLASLRQLLATAGFTVDEEDTSTFRLRFASGSALLRHFFIRLGFVPAWKAVVTPGREQVTFERLEAALNRTASELGELALSIPMAGVVAHRQP